MCVFFFFKQKTAYEMRISDWSSDVCSSDLRAAQVRGRVEFGLEVGKLRPALPRRGRIAGLRHETVDHAVELDPVVKVRARELLDALDMVRRYVGIELADHAPARRTRSEEQTSELPSLIPCPYAALCLTKKK